MLHSSSRASSSYSQQPNVQSRGPILNPHSSEFRPSSSSSSSTHSTSQPNTTNQNLSSNVSSSLTMNFKGLPKVQIEKILGEGRSKEGQGAIKTYNSVAWNVSGRKLASCAANITGERLTEPLLQIWSADVWKPELDIKKNVQTSLQLVWDPTDECVFATAHNRGVTIWDVRLKDGKGWEIKDKRCETPTNPINIAWSPDGRYIACGVKEDAVTFVDPRVPALSAAASAFLGSKRLDKEVNELTWSPTGDILLVTTGMGSVEVFKWYWEKFDAVPLKSIPAHNATIFSVKYDPTGKMFAVGSVDLGGRRSIRREYICLKTVGSQVYPIRSVSFSHDSSLLALGSEEPQLEIYHVDSGEKVHTISTDISINSIAWSPKQNVLAYCGSEYIRPVIDETEKKDYRDKNNFNLKFFLLDQVKL
eukprot:TRINITY_DN4859_c0_g3_i4.p1 TRINITY_DN4859_c0_g3~~TRINITY_DN4859_c0_g3_i4.p1  ORF type:complete len:419 (+),score=86.28 TRINITY_DN4859_c0_g3_i4:156-1412(+)